MDRWLAVVGILAVLVAAGSRRFDDLPVTETMVALAVGLLLGRSALGVLDVPPAQRIDLLHQVARLTLAVSLMAVALRYPLGDVLRRRRAVLWLLGLVLPFMAGVGALLSAGMLSLGAGAALVLGASLAPTDPVLASSVVSGPSAQRVLPDPLRQGLSLESGANDGLALPLVVVALAVGLGTSVRDAALEAVWAVVGAVVLGSALGWLAGRLLMWAEQHGDVDPSREVLSSLLLAFGTLGVAALVRVDGLLAVFVTGLAYNASTSGRERQAEERLDEAVNRFLVLPLFVLLGVLAPWDGWRDLGTAGVVFVVGVLLLRRLPVVLVARSLVGAPRLPDAVWLGWFGPIGVAAVYYLTEVERRGLEEPRVWAAGTLVVVASTLVHGVTAAPGRRWYDRASRAGRGR